MQNRQCSDNVCSPRRQYKRWMTQDGFADLPKTTKWRRKHTCDEQDVNESQHGFVGDIEHLERQSDNFLAQERPEQSIPSNTFNHTAHIDEPELEEHNMGDPPGIFDFDFDHPEPLEEEETCEPPVSTCRYLINIQNDIAVFILNFIPQYHDMPSWILIHLSAGHEDTFPSHP